MVNNLFARTLANPDREVELLRMINSVSFDFTFLYDCSSNSAIITKYIGEKMTEPKTIYNVAELLLSRVHPDDLTILEKELRKASQGVADLSFEVRIKERVGRRYRWHSVKMRLDQEESLYVGASVYIDRRKNKESELTLKARQDPLTGLLNKMVTKDIINEYLRKHPGEECALIVFDIDHFKSYNDALGHLFGDEIIKECASRIRKVFMKDAFVGRIGGDEFVAFVRNLDDISLLVQRMGRLRDRFADITLGQRSNFKVTCSIGIALSPDMGSDYDSLFKCADMAMYSVKNDGRNNYAFYTEDLYVEEGLLESEKDDDNADFESREPYSLTNFAFRILNDAENVSSAINLLLYRIKTEYNLEAIHIYEFDPQNMRTECTYEIKKDKYPVNLGRRIEFSHKAWRVREAEMSESGGYRVYDFTKPEEIDPGNGISEWEGVKSLLHVSLHLFGKNRGCVDLISANSAKTWSENRIGEMVSVCNLMAVCMYYSSKVQKAEREVSRYMEYDTLTGLLKEDGFVEAATKIIATKANTSRLAVVYCDISNFKYINEAYGYVIGDKILSYVADFVSNRIPGVLCTGRFYSDNILCITEFAHDITDAELVKNVEKMNEILSSELSEKFGIKNISVRTGIYIIPNSHADALQSISNANMARKLAKTSQGARCIVFDQEMFEKRKRQIGYIQKLDEAIANEEFYVVMQPKVSGSKNNLVGAEALARWRMADGTEVFPGDFVPAFEKDGSIVKLDFYVYEKVMAYIRQRLDEGKKVLPVSMNVSRAHVLTSDFVPKFKALIDKYEVPTQFIELELTESIYLENLQTFNEMIDELRILGIKISMDDFGSGYSSLNALNDLKIDLLKIDKIFMRDATLNESDKTIIRFIIDMAKNLCMNVICEGVETQSQREFLNAAGCDLQQGYLYSKPVSIETFNEFIDNEELLFSRVG